MVRVWNVLIGWLVTIVPLTGAQNSCKTQDVGVLLNDCQPERVNIPDGGNVTLEFGVYIWTLPFVNLDGSIDGTFVMHAKGFGLNGGPITAPGPTLVVPKGARFGINIENGLPTVVPPIPPEDVGKEINNGVYVNVHTHGLHVGADEDDVTVKVFPGETYPYRYTLPTDHAGGSHWYHPHTHPLSVLFAASGAAGLLVIEDSPDGTEVPTIVQEMEEFDLVFLYVSPAQLYDYHNGLNDQFSPMYSTRDYFFKLDFSSKNLNEEQGLALLKRHMILVNGFLRPVIEVETGKWYRLRMLNVSPVFDLSLGVYDQDKANPARCVVKLLSRDGVYLPKGMRDINFDRNHTVHLHPANRADVLIRCEGNPGSIAEMFDNFNEFGEDGLIRGGRPLEVYKREFVSSFRVIARSTPPSQDDPPANFQFTPCLPVYLQDLQDATVLQYGGIPAADRKAFQDSKVIRDQTEFWDSQNQTFLVTVNPWMVNQRSFSSWDFNPDSSQNITMMYVGAVQQWELTQESANHPLHIHVNHFQLLEDIVDIRGFHKAGDWVDTIRPRSNVPVRFRFRTDIFTGRIPLHCHNLVHSDDGAKAQAWVLDRSATVDPIYQNNRRPWNSLCSTPVTFSTPRPTASPTKSPSRTPTKQPTNFPTASPTTPIPTKTPTLFPTQSPTNAPTITKIEIELPSIQRVFPHEGVVIAPVLLNKSPFVEVEYCWRKSSDATYDFAPEVEALLQGADRDDCDSDDDPAVARALEVAYPTGRRRPYFIIKPWILEQSEFPFTLTVKQGGNTDTATIVVRSYVAPSAGAISVFPRSGIAGSTRFNIVLNTNSTVGQPPYRYRFGIQMNTLEGDIIALSSEGTSNSLSNVLLPLMDDAEISFVSVVATVIDANGAESKFSAPDFVRLARPTQTLQVSSGFDVSNPEDVLRSTLAYGSVLGRVSSNSREVESKSAQQAEELVKNIESAWAVIKASPFSFKRYELLIFALKNVAFAVQLSTSGGGPVLAKTLLEALDGIMVEIDRTAARQTSERGLENRVYIISLGVRDLLFETVAAIVQAASICDSSEVNYGTKLWDKFLLFIEKTSVPGLVDAGLESTDRVAEAHVRYDQANLLGGSFRFSDATEVQIPETILVASTLATYDNAGLLIVKVPPKAFCGISNVEEVPSNGNETLGNSTLAGRGDGGDTEDQPIVIEDEDPSFWSRFQGGYTGRRLQVAQTPLSSASSTSAAFTALVSDILFINLGVNTSSTPMFTPFFNVTLQVLPLSFPTGSLVSGVACGVYEYASQEWDGSLCNSGPREALPALEDVLRQGGTLSCTCSFNQASARATVGAFVVVEPVVIEEERSFNVGVLLKLILPVLAMWFLLSMWGFGTDKADAQLVQKGALLAFLANRTGKKGDPKSDKSKRFLLRSAFKTMQDDAARGYTGDGPAVQHDTILVKLEKAHSVVGLLFFDSLVPRLLKSLVLPILLWGALAIVFVLQQYFPDLSYVVRIVLSAVFVGFVAFMSRQVLLILARIQKKEFHRVAHLRRKAIALSVAGMKQTSSSSSQLAPQSNPDKNAEEWALTPKVDEESGMVAQDAPPEEDELRQQQLQLFLFSHSLKALQDQHNRLEPFWLRLWMHVRTYFWFMGQDAERVYLNRVYGGKVSLSNRYREARLRLHKTEVDYNLRPGPWIPLLVWFLYILLTGSEICTLVLASLEDVSLGEWVLDSVLALAGGLCALEPFLLLVALLSQRKSEPKVLFKPRGRFYSWDSNISTRTEHRTARRPTIEDLEVRSHRRPSTKHSRFFFIKAQDDKEEEPELTSNHREDIEEDDSGYETQTSYSRPRKQSSFSSKQGRLSFFSRRKSVKKNTRRPSSSSEDDIDYRPDDCDYV